MCLFLITLGEPVSYPVNQVDGFELTIEKPTWSPFKGSKGTVKLERGSNSSKKIMDAVENLYLRIADRYTGIRRIEVCANRVAPESYVQYSLFDDPKQTDKERHLQEAVLNVKQRYGKNAIMRGSNLLECSTYRERNEQIGGHRA